MWFQYVWDIADFLVHCSAVVHVSVMCSTELVGVVNFPFWFAISQQLISA